MRAKRIVATLVIAALLTALIPVRALAASVVAVTQPTPSPAEGTQAPASPGAEGGETAVVGSIRVVVADDSEAAGAQTRPSGGATIASSPPTSHATGIGPNQATTESVPATDATAPDPPIAPTQAFDVVAGAGVDGYRRGGGHGGWHWQPRTLYTWAASDDVAVNVDGNEYLTADRIQVISQSGADPDAAATQIWWHLVNLAIRTTGGDPTTPGFEGDPLISWSGGNGPVPEGYDRLADPQNPFFGYLNRGVSPPDRDVTLTITIYPPGGGTPVSASLSCAQKQLLCGSGGSGVSLLDPNLYAGTSLESGFASIGGALDDLTGQFGPLGGLDELIAGPGATITDGRFARSQISGVGGPIYMNVTQVRTYADGRGARGEARLQTPDTVLTVPIAFASPLEDPSGAGGRGAVSASPGGVPGAAQPLPAGPTNLSAGGAEEPLLTSSGSTGGAVGSGGVGRDGKDEGSEPQGPPEGKPKPPKPASFAPSADDGSILLWVGAAAAAVALLALGLFGWRRQQGGGA